MLSACFDTIYDAWVFFDESCDFKIQQLEMKKALRQLGIHEDPLHLMEVCAC